MSIIRPPVTGDFVLDSFLNQLVTELSTTAYAAADLERSLLSVDTNSFSATIYLYLRSETNTQPSPISTEITYNYQSGKIQVNGTQTDVVDGWHFGTPPSVTDGAYYWQTYVHISSDKNRETISPESWSTPEIVAADLTIDGIPTPTRPANVRLQQINSDTLELSWEFAQEDLEHPGLYAVVEYQYPDAETPEWKPYAYLTTPSSSLVIDSVTALGVKKAFRVRAGNVLTNEVSPWGTTRVFTPVAPNVPENLVLERISGDLASLSWDYTPNFSKVQLFELEVAYENGVYDLKAIVGPQERKLTIDNLGGLTDETTYRLRALGFNDKFGAYSNVVTLTPLTPSKPTSVDFVRTSKNEGVLSWSMVDNEAELSHFNIEESVGDESNFTFVGSVGSNTSQIRRVGLSSEDDTVYFRVQAVGLNRLASEYSDSTVFAPAVPNTPTSLTYQRLNEDEGLLTWDYVENYATVRSFIIQMKESGATSFTTAATVDGEDRDFILQGLSVRKKTFEYRVIAVSTHGKKSIASSVVSVEPTEVIAPTGLTVQSVEQVGTVTSVKLNWTPPEDTLNQYSTITAQLFHESDNTWKDVATVPAESSVVEFQPSRQGTLQFRVRSTAVNGLSSEPSEPISVYISGGSATDTAIYNGDSAFVASQHYSVNSDDRVLSNSGDVDVISGGSYDPVTNKVTGQSNTELVMYWWVDITTNMVTRKRHFYLNLENLQNTSTELVPWSIDRGNVLVEILTSPNDTEDFYQNDGTPLDSYIYIGSGQADANIRSYDLRSPDFMYASREYISLTMKRTFTFRQQARAVVKLTFKPVLNDAPVIDLSSGNELKLEAFASELIDDYEGLPITNDTSDPDGTLWTFDENFEAAPKIFITPSTNTTTWVTDKTATSCVIHAADDCTVDLTARGR